jgi:hypothetical protein
MSGFKIGGDLELVSCGQEEAFPHHKCYVYNNI